MVLLLGCFLLLGFALERLSLSALIALEDL